MTMVMAISHSPLLLANWCLRLWEKDVEKFVTVQTESGLYLKTHTNILSLQLSLVLSEEIKACSHQDNFFVLCKKLVVINVLILVNGF